MICAVSCGVFDDIRDDHIVPYPGYYWQAPLTYDDSKHKRSLNVAAVAFHVDISPEVNRVKIVEFIDRIKSERPDVRLILFSETTLGHCYRTPNPSEYQKSIAETIPGETTNVLSQKAIEHQIYISLGMMQKSGDDLYNSQVLINPDGDILSIHHKNYLTPEDKKNGVKAGKGITVDIIDNIKVATIICADIQSLEIDKMIHKSGAELVLASFAEVPAIINGIYLQYVYAWVLGADRVDEIDGLKFLGTLFLNAPSGENRVKSVKKEGYIYGVVKCK